jgi:copper(I)-binding protein
VTRWTRRLLIGAIAMLVPLLAGCEAGLNAPTLTFHPASNGTSTTVNGITIDNAFVLGPPLGSALPPGGRAGVFLALVATNGDRLVAVSAPSAATSVRLTDVATRVLAPGQLVTLTGPSPQIVLTGLINPLSGGNSVQLTFVFANAGAITIYVPVEPHAYYYATYSPPPIPRPTLPRVPATATASPTVSPAASASPSTTP